MNFASFMKDKLLTKKSSQGSINQKDQANLENDRVRVDMSISKPENRQNGD